MNKFLKRPKIPTLIQEEIANPNSSISIKEIGIVVENLPTKKTSSPCVFIEEFYQIFKKERISFLYKLFPKN